MSLQQALTGYREQQNDAREQARQKGDPLMGMLLQYDAEDGSGDGALLADYLEAPDGTFQRTEDSWRVNPIVSGEKSYAADDGEPFEQQIYAGFVGEPGDGDELTDMKRQIANYHEFFGYAPGIEWLAKQTAKVVNQRNTGGLFRGRGTPYGAFGLMAGQDENGDYRLFELDPAGYADEYSARVAGAPREKGTSRELREMQESLAEEHQERGDELGIEEGVELTQQLYEETFENHAPSDFEFEPGALNITHLSYDGVTTQTLDDWLESFDDS